MEVPKEGICVMRTGICMIMSSKEGREEYPINGQVRVCPVLDVGHVDNEVFTVPNFEYPITMCTSIQAYVLCDMIPSVIIKEIFKL